jgi:hypothetical protein
MDGYTTCPVLTLTPDVEEAFAWFHATHELARDQGRLFWRRTSLPAAGGVGDQDARLMATIEHLAAVQGGILAEQQARRTTEPVHEI